jgi:hypothetical protein
MLAELMRLRSNIAVAGTHGKTTTTTLVATLLDAGGIDPTVINGGIIHAYGSNARVGQGEWMVVEADESDGTFNRLPATIAIVTNIDPEHHGALGQIRERCARGSSISSPTSRSTACRLLHRHPEVQALVGRVTDRRVVTFGFNAQADVRAVNLTYKGGVAHFDIALQAEDTPIEGCTLPMPGDHNVSNALAAVAVARHLGMKRDEIREALAGFGGSTGASPRWARWRRDHHRRLRPPPGGDRRGAEGRAAGRGDGPGDRRAPAAPLHAAATCSTDFCACFNDADVVGIAEVYAAGEDPIAGASRDDLVAGLIRHGHRHARAVTSTRTTWNGWSANRPGRATWWSASARARVAEVGHAQVGLALQRARSRSWPARRSRARRMARRGQHRARAENLGRAQDRAHVVRVRHPVEQHQTRRGRPLKRQVLQPAPVERAHLQRRALVHRAGVERGGKLARIGDLGHEPRRGTASPSRSSAFFVTTRRSLPAPGWQRIAHRVQPEEPDRLGRRRLAPAFLVDDPGRFFRHAPSSVHARPGLRPRRPRKKPRGSAPPGRPMPRFFG